jgi:hypothetical protein
MVTHKSAIVPKIKAVLSSATTGFGNWTTLWSSQLENSELYSTRGTRFCAS